MSNNVVFTCPSSHSGIYYIPADISGLFVKFRPTVWFPKVVWSDRVLSLNDVWGIWKKQLRLQECWSRHCSTKFYFRLCLLYSVQCHVVPQLIGSRQFHEFFQSFTACVVLMIVSVIPISYTHAFRHCPKFSWKGNYLSCSTSWRNHCCMTL